MKARLRMKELEGLITLFEQTTSKSELRALLKDLLTKAEIKTLIERWKTVSFLLDGDTHRNVQKKVGTSISKVTHAANLLKKDGKGFRLVFARLKK
jgi:Trp operon repressor